MPKDGGRKTRLIFHLSYPKCNNMSVNAGIPKEYCTVKYPVFDEAVRMCIAKKKNCRIAKSDMSMAFRNVPCNPQSWAVLVLKCQHPITRIWYFFFDKALPFGSSISCRIFQDFSDSIAFIVSSRTLKRTLNYLDDYLFVAMRKNFCDHQVRVFLQVCKTLRSRYL